jgi:23S rRNA (adenine2503-C2)-methyltransferase
MSLHLYRHGILTKLRQSAGQDIAGGCGQLRAQIVARAPAVRAGVRGVP